MKAYGPGKYTNVNTSTCLLSKEGSYGHFSLKVGSSESILSSPPKNNNTALKLIFIFGVCTLCLSSQDTSHMKVAHCRTINGGTQ